MRARDVAKLAPGTTVVVGMRELGQRLPEQLAFVQFNADRQTWHPAERRFTVAIKCSTESLWVLPSVVHRVATAVDRERLTVEKRVTVGAAR